MPPENWFKFVDDLTTLEIVLSMLSIGLYMYNVKMFVPSHISTSKKYIPAETLKPQNYLNRINKWTANQKMLINEKKTKFYSILQRSINLILT